MEVVQEKSGYYIQVTTNTPRQGSMVVSDYVCLVCMGYPADLNERAALDAALEHLQLTRDTCWLDGTPRQYTVDANFEPTIRDGRFVSKPEYVCYEFAISKRR